MTSNSAALLLAFDALTVRVRRQAAILSAVNDAQALASNGARGGPAFEALLGKILDLSGCRRGVIAERIEEPAEEEESAPTYRVLAGPSPDRALDSVLTEALASGSVTGRSRAPSPLTEADAAAAKALGNVLVLPLMLDGDVLGAMALADRGGDFNRDLAEELSPVVGAVTCIVAEVRSMRRREAAEQASRLKSAFLAQMNHELRTPLSGVIANLELLRGSGLSKEKRELVEASMSAGKGLLAVIGDTLDLSKIEADKLTLEPAEFDLVELVESVKSIYLAAAGEKQTELTTAICAGVPRRIVADENRLRQILSNLVSNSVKFTDQGRICISLQAEPIDARTARLHILVDDTGIGFSPDTAKSLFQPFQQADPSIARDFGGTGLGLAIAQRLAALHGGAITCAAEPGAGASFMVKLPVSVADWSTPAPADLTGHSLVFLTPQSAPPAALLDELEAAGAQLRVVDAPEAAGPKGENGQRSLIVDWDCGAAQAAALLAEQSRNFARILTVAPRGDARRRRRWLAAGKVEPVAAPLSVAGIAAALGAATCPGAAPKPEPASGTAEIHRFAPGEGPSLLVVEDQPMNRKILQRQLAGLGIDCDLAESGPEALTLLDHRDYEVIITDCAMPVMDGLELIRRVRAEEEAAGRPRSTVIALTANTLKGGAQACYDAGADVYLTKPLKLAELSAILTQERRPGAGTAPREHAVSGEAAGRNERAAAPIDRTALAGLIGRDDPRLIDQLARDFFYCWQDSFAAIAQRFAARDAKGLAEAAHAAKGTAQYGAAERLAAGCARLEQLARAGRWADSAAAVEELKIETGHLQCHLTKSGLIGYEHLRSA